MNFAAYWRIGRTRDGRIRAGRKAGRRKNALTFVGLDGLEVRTVPTFLAPVGFAAGVSPFASVVGDFNNDGRPDVVVTNTTRGR